LFETANITVLNTRSSTPSLAQLQEFDVVLVWNNFTPSNPTLLGDRLAAFVDQGGGVVMATYAFSSPWSVRGRIFADGYSPFEANASRRCVSGTMNAGSANLAHPILDGITGLSYWSNCNYTNSPLDQGAQLIARDTAGNTLIAVNASGTVAGVSIYPPFAPQRVWDMLANALQFVQ
jgi:hypothetical protein